MPDVDFGIHSVQICLEKGLVTAEGLRQMVEEIQMAGHQGHGQKLVAHAWTDPAFKARLLRDGGSAAAELGISADGVSSKAGITGTESTHSWCLTGYICHDVDNPILVFQPVF